MGGGSTFLALLLIVIGLTLALIGARRRSKAFINELKKK